MKRSRAQISQLAVRAARAGFFPIVCPRCQGASRACANCSGQGRIWQQGGMTLDDAGIARLLATGRTQAADGR